MRRFPLYICGAVAAVGLGNAAARAKQPLTPIDAIIVHKAARTMVLLAHGREVRVIRGIQLGNQPLGAKHFKGDGRTPEGRYVINYGNRDSSYHYGLHISYPNKADLAYARAMGKSPGGDIFIHGQPNDWPQNQGSSRVPGDWTNGCIALSDAEIEDLWQSVGDGTLIDIRP